MLFWGFDGVVLGDCLPCVLYVVDFYGYIIVKSQEVHCEVLG